MKRGLLLLLLSLYWASEAAKPVNWRAFRLADGMPSVVCSAVNVDSQGRVLVSHPDISSVTEYDGYNLREMGPPLPDARRFYVSPAGQLWALTKKGLNEFRDPEWVLHTPRELGLDMPLTNEWIDSPVLCPIRQGVVLLLLPDRLVQFTSEPGHTHRIELIRESKETALGSFNSIMPGRNGTFWVSGRRGIARLQFPARAGDPQGGWEDFPAPDDWRATDFSSLHQGLNGAMTLIAHSPSNTNVLLITSFDGQNWTGAKEVNRPIRHAWPARGGGWWAVTDKMLLQYSDREPEPIENRELPVKRYFDVATDASGTFWLATSDGLLRYMPLLWDALPVLDETNGAIRSLAPDPDAGIWYLSNKGLHWWNEDRETLFVYPENLRTLSQSAKSIFPLKRGMIAIQSADGLLTFNRDSRTFQPVRAEQGAKGRCEALGYLKEGFLAIREVGLDGQLSSRTVYSFDGVTTGSVLTFPENGMDGLTAFLTTQTGDIWISGLWGTGWWHEGKWHSFSRGQNPGPMSAKCFIESPDSTIWCAAAEGVWQFDGKTWHLLRQEAEGANWLTRTRDGSIWVASKRGVARYWQGAWIEHGLEEGLPALEVTRLCEDRSDHLWAATPSRICIFQPKADQDAPRTGARLMTQKQSAVYEGATATVSFQAEDKWKFTVRSRLLYSYHLDGRTWSPFAPADRATLSELSAGKHYFQVRSMDRNGNVDPLPASFEFNVLVPWYREGRLVVISSIGAALALFFAALALNRHRRLLRSYSEVEQKVAQRTLELEKAHRELWHSQKMTALGTLAAGIAHDFNNILSIIKGSAQIIEENLHDPHKVETRLDRIKTVVEQGTGIVKAMLGFSRDSSQESDPCDINETVKDTIRLLGDRFVREVEIRFEPESGLPPTRCSKDLVQQILLNFVFNAVESASKDRTISISTRKCTSPPNGTVLLPCDSKEYVSIAVKDKGSGIRPEVLPRIFEPFFTTKGFSTRRGTGLGLSMVYEFATKLNAGLAVESSVGQGSTFTLVLPVTARPAEIPGLASPVRTKSDKAVVHT